jgi:hypothetical protein
MLTSVVTHAGSSTTVIVPPPQPHTDTVLDVITGLLFLATLGLAVYTAKLRKATVDLAGDTIQGNKLSDRHHQESLSPVCLLKDANCSNSGDGRYFLAFSVQNAGSGPALLVNVHVTPVGPGLQQSGMARGELPYTLAAGETKKHEMAGLTFSKVPSQSPDAYKSFLVKVEFLSMFNSWGTGKWTVLEGQGVRFVVSYDLPAPQERVTSFPAPGPLSSEVNSPKSSGEENVPNGT